MSRELDAEVAQTVYGWVWARTPTGNERWLVAEEYRWSSLRGGRPREDLALATDEVPRASNWDCMVPRFSTDISAAMPVFQVMVEQFGAGHISLDMEDSGRGQGHIYCVGMPDGNGCEYTAEGPLPEAICRAAIVALAAAAETPA